jgi:hypothetical protein
MESSTLAWNPTVLLEFSFSFPSYLSLFHLNFIVTHFLQPCVWLHYVSSRSRKNEVCLILASAILTAKQDQQLCQAQFFVLFNTPEHKPSINNIGYKISVSVSKKAHCIPITNTSPFMMIWKEYHCPMNHKKHLHSTCKMQSS